MYKRQELLALLYLGATGTVFRNFWSRSPYFSAVFRRGGFLTVSYLITNLTLNMDRLVLKHLIGDLAVTQYYVTSLIGKTMVLLVAPVNTILISYLTRKKERISRRQFLGFTGIGVGVSFLFFLFAQIATPIFIRLLYGELYEGVRDLITEMCIRDRGYEVLEAYNGSEMLRLAAPQEVHLSLIHI